MGKVLFCVLFFCAISEAIAQKDIPVYPITHGCLDLSSGKQFYLIQSGKDARTVVPFQNDYCKSYGLEVIDYTKYSALIYNVEVGGISNPIFRPELILDGNVAVFTVHIFGEATYTREGNQEFFTVKFPKLPDNVEFQYKTAFHNSGKPLPGKR